MVLFGSIREDIFLILAIVVAVVLAIFGLLNEISPFELSQLLIVLVFLGIAVTLAERMSRNQKNNDFRLDNMETRIKGLRTPPPPLVALAPPPPPPAQAPAVAQLVPTSVSLSMPVGPPPRENSSGMTVEYLADESRKASFIEAVLNSVGTSDQGYRLFITAENASDRQGPTPNGLPLREETCLGPVNAGTMGLMRIFLDPVEEEDQEDGKRENVARWLITLRNKIIPKYRNILLKQAIAKEFQFVPMLMCVPMAGAPDILAPVHVILSLGKGQKISGVSSTVHVTMKNSVFQKSFLNRWMRYVIENPDYEYDQQEETRIVSQKFDASATEFSKVDLRAAKLISDNIESILRAPTEVMAVSVTGTGREELDRYLRNEYLKTEWKDLIESLSDTRGVLASQF